MRFLRGEGFQIKERLKKDNFVIRREGLAGEAAPAFPLNVSFMQEGETDMWQCQRQNCGYIYNQEKGDRKGKIAPGTPFEDLPEDWKCPLCGAGKQMFEKIG